MEDLINFAAVSLAGDVHWGKAEKVALANSKNPDEIHTSAFHQGLHCLLRLDQTSGTEINCNSEYATCDPLNYIMDNPCPYVDRFWPDMTSARV